MLDQMILVCIIAACLGGIVNLLRLPFVEQSLLVSEILVVGLPLLLVIATRGKHRRFWMVTTVAALFSAVGFFSVLILRPEGPLDWLTAYRSALDSLLASLPGLRRINWDVGLPSFISTCLCYSTLQMIAALVGGLAASAMWSTIASMSRRARGRREAVGAPRTAG